MTLWNMGQGFFTFINRKGFAPLPRHTHYQEAFHELFLLISLGFSLLFLALSYYVIDILKFRRLFLVPLAVGLNPLFIFLFAHSGGADWFMNIVEPFSNAILGWAGQGWAQAGTALGCLALMCALCYIMLRKKLFIKI
ncbi:MAG: hypothetical protein ACP5J6_11140 [Candidatus Saccharicenans sp.]